MLNSFTSKVRTVPKPVDYSEQFQAQRKWLEDQRAKQEPRQ